MNSLISLDIDLYSEFIEKVKQDVENSNLNLCPIGSREVDSSEFMVPEVTEVYFSVSN